VTAMNRILVAFALAVVLPAFAADPPKSDEPKAFTDPDKAGPDFQIQGEYVGDAAGGRTGAQVIADGNGQFTVRILAGGLPGEGWDEKTVAQGSGKTADGKTTFTITEGVGRGIKAEVVDGVFRGSDEQGGKGELKRVVRHSPTEGAKPPEDAVVLFDGKNADAWDHGKIENGLLSVSVPNGQTSKRKFRDCMIHVEFILPFMPKARGQGRANSGVFVDGRYEVQVLDSFALAGRSNECGAIYSLKAPKINMCYPPLQWQTYDIDFTAPRFGVLNQKTETARITVKHNGVPVQTHFELTKLTLGNLLPDNEEPGPIHLQNHGNPVFYRNIWVVPKQ
jgi:hypothetical protein